MMIRVRHGLEDVLHSGVDGKPIVNLHFSCKGKCRVSISHTESHAIASAIFISK